MHKARELCSRVLGRRGACGVPFAPVSAKDLPARARAAVGPDWAKVLDEIAALGKTVGAPWGKDQKEAALAAATVLRGARKDGT